MATQIKVAADDIGLVTWARERREAELRTVLTGGSQLRSAVWAAAVSIAALMTALGVVWLSPAAAPPAPLIRIKYYDGGDTGNPATACGPLISSNKNNTLLLQVASGGATHAVEINGGWITRVQLTRTCP